MIIALAASWLIVRTFSVDRTTALIGAGALASAIAALSARILDAQACSFIPVGSHFMWHIFLSTAAFLCMLTLVRLKEVRTLSHAAQR